MNRNRILTYLSLFCIHFLLIFIGFPGQFKGTDHTLFCDYGDGIKNYFTLQSYVIEPVVGSFVKYNSFDYPFGDYVYYTDNTPFFAVPFKWVCTYVCDLSTHTLQIFNFFILASIVASALLIYYLFSQFITSRFLVYALAVVLPWVNIQLPRIWQGHFNLSCAVVVLVALFLFIRWFKNKDAKTGITWLAAMVLFLPLAFFVHGYYLAIVGVFWAGLFLFTGLQRFKTRQGIFEMSLAVLVPLAGMAISLAIVMLTDGYYLLRKENAMDYDHANLKTNFIQLFTHYDFQTLAFPIASTMERNTEGMVYLGNIGLFALATLWVGCVLSTPFRKKVWAIQTGFFSNPLRKAMVGGGLLSLAVSFGERYDTNRDDLRIFTPFPALNAMPTNTLLIGIAVFALFVFGIVAALSQKVRGNLQQAWSDYRQKPGKKALHLLIIAVMVYLFVGQYSVCVHNMANPFLYIHRLTKKVEQFRSLSRFIWPFFWVFYIWIGYTLAALLKTYSKTTQYMIYALVLVAGVWELTDYMVEIRKKANDPNPFSAQALTRFKPLKTDLSTYQAMLPIPYYTVGSEDYPHTIDDNNGWSLYTMQLSLYSHLPLMACKMSRTPPGYALALLSLVSDDQLIPALKNKLNNKPILIAVNQRLLADPTQADICSSGRAITRDYYKKANAFVARHHLVAVDSLGDVVFYGWEVK